MLTPGPINRKKCHGLYGGGKKKEPMRKSPNEKSTDGGGWNFREGFWGGSGDHSTGEP